MNTFNVGDRVRVVRKVFEEAGWNYPWVGGMDDYVGNGEVYVISASARGGCYFGGFNWPAGALEPAGPLKNWAVQYDEEMDWMYKLDGTPLGADDGAGIWLLLMIKYDGIYDSDVEQFGEDFAKERMYSGGMS